MESDKTRVLRIVRNADLRHPGLPLVEAFLNDAVDGDQAARYLLQTYADKGNDADFTRFVKDWTDLVRLCRIYRQDKMSTSLNTHSLCRDPQLKKSKMEFKEKGLATR